MTKRFELTTDANTDAILLIIDHQDDVMFSFLKDHEEAVKGVFQRLNAQDIAIQYARRHIQKLENRINALESQLRQCQSQKEDNGRFKVWQTPPFEGKTFSTTTGVKRDD